MHRLFACIVAVMTCLTLCSTQGKPPDYVFIGCFYDSNKRPLDTMVQNFRHGIDWYHLKKTIDRCASRVKADGRYEYFGIQFYGECWSGVNASSTFANVGPAPISKCAGGVGSKWVNAVYKLVKLPPCSSNLQFQPRPSSGTVHELIWCSDKPSPSLEMVFGYPVRITGIGVQGKYPDKWITSFTVEYSEGESFKPYREKGLARVFQGNVNWFDLKLRWFINPTEGLKYRITPTAWTPPRGPVCARFRLFGCRLH